MAHLYAKENRSLMDATRRNAKKRTNRIREGKGNQNRSLDLSSDTETGSLPSSSSSPSRSNSGSTSSSSSSFSDYPLDLCLSSGIDNNNNNGGSYDYDEDRVECDYYTKGDDDGGGDDYDKEDNGRNIRTEKNKKARKSTGHEKKRRRLDVPAITFEDDIALPFVSRKGYKTLERTPRKGHGDDSNNPLLSERDANGNKRRTSSSSRDRRGGGERPRRRIVVNNNQHHHSNTVTYAHIMAPLPNVGPGIAPAIPAIASATPAAGAVPSGGTGTGTGASRRGGGGEDSDDWIPCAVSEDYDVYLRTGINPRERHLQGRKCYGCGLHGGGAGAVGSSSASTMPVKRKNVEVFFRRMDEAAADIPDAFARSALLEADYDRLIKDPTKRLKSLLDKRSSKGLGGCYDDNDDDDNERDANYSEDDGNDYVAVCKRKKPSPSRKRCRNDYDGDEREEDEWGEEEENEEEEEEEDDESWNKVDIYNHITRHGNSVMEDINYLRRSTMSQIKLIEDNSLYLAHRTKKNAFGEPLKQANESQARCYQALIRSYLDLSKSRPDTMVPFYDGRRTATPRAIIGAGGAGSGGATSSTSTGATLILPDGRVVKKKASLADVGGQLLYGKGL